MPRTPEASWVPARPIGAAVWLQGSGPRLEHICRSQGFKRTVRRTLRARAVASLNHPNICTHLIVGRSFACFARLVPGVVFGFEAVVLQQIGVRKKLLNEIDRDRPGK